MKYLGYVGSLLLGALLAADLAAAEEPVGTAVGVRQRSMIELNGALNGLSEGDGLFLGQRVVTTQSGQVEIEFSDGTRMVVGPNAQLLIEEYLLRNDQTVSSFAVTALSGSFRFFSGDSPKNAYEITTPTGTISVRGTAFDFDVLEDGSVPLVQFVPGVEMCGADACVDLELVCELGLITKDGHATVVGDQERRLAIFEDYFPYAKSQRALRRDYRVDNPSQCLREEFAGPYSTGSIGASGGATGTPLDEPPTDTTGTGCNKGLGNGAECDEGGDVETENPGQGSQNKGKGQGGGQGHGNN